MMIKIENIDPNPYRNFDNFPLDPENLKRLETSYDMTGDFGVLTVRPFNGGYQLACGHHRLEAQKRLGATQIDCKSMPLTELEMVQIMVNENATQRGTDPAAVQDSIAASIRIAAFEILRYENFNDFKQFSMVSRFLATLSAWSSSRGKLKNGSGLGARLLMAITGNVFSETIVRETIAILKSNGVVLDIITRVTLEISGELAAIEDARLEAIAEAETEARLEAEAEARRVAAKAKRKLQEAIDTEKRAIREAKKAEKRALKRAESTRAKREATAERKRLAADARAKREAAEAAAKIERKRQEKIAAAARKMDKKRARLEREKIAAEKLAVELVQREAEIKLAAVVDQEAVSLFKKTKHQSTFAKLLRDDAEGKKYLRYDQQIQIAQEVIRRCEAGFRKRVTADSIKSVMAMFTKSARAFERMVRRQDLAAEKRQRKISERISLTEKQDRIERDLSNGIHHTATAVNEYAAFLKKNPHLVGSMNAYGIRMGIEKLVEGLSELDKMLDHGIFHDLFNMTRNKTGEEK